MEALGVTILGQQFGWLFPSALLTLCAILIPLVIHLLSKNLGTLVRIGNIHLIPVKKIKKVNEIRLVERLLLMLRVLIFAVLAILLAQLFFKHSSANIHYEHHILVTQDWLNHAEVSEKTRLLQQLKNKETVSLLIDGQEPQLLTEESVETSTNDEPSSAINVWQQTATYIDKVKENASIRVYTTNRLNQFIGQKVSLDRDIDWRIKEVPSRVNRDSVTETINVVILIDEGEENRTRYLDAALQVLKRKYLTGLTLNKHIAVDVVPQIDNADVIFDFRAQAPSDEVVMKVRGGAKLILVATSQSQRVDAKVDPHIFANNVLKPTLHNGFNLSLVGKPPEFQENVFNGNPELLETKAVWKTDRGDALLLKRLLGKGEVLSFFSRFDPKWNDWVLLSSFPHDLAGLITPEALSMKKEDTLLADSRLSYEQISQSDQQSHRNLSSLNENMSRNDNAAEDHESLWPYFALLLFALFCLERLFSELTLREKSENPTHMQDEQGVG